MEEINKTIEYMENIGYKCERKNRNWQSTNKKQYYEIRKPNGFFEIGTFSPIQLYKLAEKIKEKRDGA